MKIYVAGSFSSQVRLREMAHKLWELGHEVTSTWLGEVAKPESMEQRTFDKKLALKDLCEVSMADLVIVDTIQRSSTGGSDTELGYALGRFQNKMIWVVGPVRSIFHHLADCNFVTWDDCLSFIKECHAAHTTGTTSTSGAVHPNNIIATPNKGGTKLRDNPFAV